MLTGRFPCEVALCLKKVCYKVSLCETVSDKVIRHSLTSVRRLAVTKKTVRLLLLDIRS